MTEILYSSLFQDPKSMSLQRSLQKGLYLLLSAHKIVFWQCGHLMYNDFISSK